MKKTNILATILILTGLALFCFATTSTFAAGTVSMIGKEQLANMLDNADVIILDVRNSEDWRKSKYKIKGAVRRQPELFDTWVKDFPRDKLLVLY